MTPTDISAARGINKLLGGCLVLLALVFLLPVVAAIYYDGIAKVPDWPLLFWGLVIFCGALIYLGAFLLLGPQRVGAEVIFRDGGFDMQVRRFFRRDQQYSVAWTDIESVKLIVVPRGGDVLAFRLCPSAAIAHGLIQPSTQFNGSKKLVSREISLPMNLCDVGVDEAFKSFEASALQSGAKFVPASSFNVVIFKHKVWSVEH